MSLITHPTSLAYQGVLIERPCAHCDTVNLHFEGLCQEGPCLVCGVARRHAGSRHHDWYTSDHEWVAHTYYPADFTVRSEAFEQMLTQVKLIGWPGHYTSDLFRDYQMLTGQGIYKERLDQQRFVWVLRSMGTHLFVPDGYGRGGLQWHAENEKTAHVFVWNPFRTELTEVNYDTARAILALPPVQYGGLVEVPRALVPLISKGKTPDCGLNFYDYEDCTLPVCNMHGDRSGR